MVAQHRGFTELEYSIQNISKEERLCNQLFELVEWLKHKEE